MNDARKYNICVRYCDTEGEEAYCATVKELPDVSVYEDTPEAAYQGAVSVVEDLQSLFESKGKAFPLPAVGSVEASGRVTLRMSRTLHQRASQAAQADDISLNQWLVEAAAWRLDGSRAAIINAPNAISLTCTTGIDNGIVLTNRGKVQTIPVKADSIKIVETAELYRVN